MAYNEFLQNHKDKKTEMKVFLTNRVMLQGKIVDFDENVIVINKCMAFIYQIVSVDIQ